MYHTLSLSLLKTMFNIFAVFQESDGGSNLCKQRWTRAPVFLHWDSSVLQVNIALLPQTHLTG